MPEIIVPLKVKEEPIKEKINEELNWYDTIKGEMLVFHGGKLSFRYKEDDYLVKLGAEERQRRGIKSTYRMLPIVENLEVKNYNKVNKITNRKEIENWFYISAYVNDIFVEDITDESIVFEVPDNEKEDFCDDLDGQGFRFND